MATVKVDKNNFKSDVLDADTPVVVDFWAEWRPWKMIGPSLEEISKEMAGKVKITKLNIDENPELAARFGVRSIPTLMLFKQGEVADIKVGALPKTALSHWISNAMRSRPSFEFGKARPRAGLFHVRIFISGAAFGPRWLSPPDGIRPLLAQKESAHARSGQSHRLHRQRARHRHRIPLPARRQHRLAPPWP